jgi:hypothetical protein
MITKLIQNVSDKLFGGAYNLALGTVNDVVTHRCLFLVWYEPEFIEEMIEKE